MSEQTVAPCWKSEDWNDAVIIDGMCACGCETVVPCTCSPNCTGN